ncbi:MAG: nicotinate (nicotinamide) nucleotide adenylyltransferase [Bryobacterales bacterium]|nr:nicotinate (nicotinamide) nucleotide adenylyltransferase [Bryobacterales bacterium]
MKTAIFGGTFDPIHNGHLRIASAAMSRWGLGRVLFVPAGKPPHKLGATTADYEHRFRMVELACRGNPEFEPSRLEAGAENSYSIETIEKVRAGLAPGETLYFLIGADAFAEIRTWKRWRDIVDSVEFLVVSRPGHGYEPPPGARIQRMEDINLRYSSSGIRRDLAAGEGTADVPAAVMAYIRVHKLYGAPAGSAGQSAPLKSEGED